MVKWRARKLIRVSTNGSGSLKKLLTKLLQVRLLVQLNLLLRQSSTFQQGTTSVIELAIEDLSHIDPFVTGRRN